MHIDSDRRSFLKWTALAMAAGLHLPMMYAAVKKKKPNIIWIMSDDLGFGDLGCYGCQDIPTPHIDRLAKNGVKCEQYYTAAPTCTPSRASLLSGRYPQAIGMTKVLMGEGGMAADVVTVAEILKQAGYATGLVGKWHLGYGGKSLPNNQGFDEFYGFRGGKIDYFKHTDSAQKKPGDALGKHDFYENIQEIFPQGYSTHLFTQRALRFIKKHAEEPFFLFLAYNAPHYARVGVLQATDEYIKRFARGEQPTRRELYAAMVSCMDDGIGELLDVLHQTGLDQNTLVMFISDNGADPEHGGSNVPLSGGKWTFKEGGIRVPMIAQWPDQIPPRTTTHEIIHGIDLFPTMLAAAGIAHHKGLSLDGIDVLKALQGKSKLPKRPLFFGESTVRQGKWKLATSRGETALYDLEADCTERVNLAGTCPDVVNELELLLKCHQRRFSNGSGLLKQ